MHAPQQGQIQYTKSGPCCGGGTLCMPHSKVKYNIQNLDLAVGGMLCMPHSKVKYNIQNLDLAVRGGCYACPTARSNTIYKIWTLLWGDAMHAPQQGQIQYTKSGPCCEGDTMHTPQHGQIQHTKSRPCCGETLCIPHSKVKYKIQLKITLPTEHYRTIPNFPEHAIKLLDHNFFAMIFYYFINIFSCYILCLFHKLIIIFTFIL